MPSEDGIDIHLRKCSALIIDLLARDDFKALGQCLGLGPAVSFHHPDQHIDTGPLTCAAFTQHFIGLTDSRCGTEENLKPPASFLSRGFQQRFRRRSRDLVRDVAVHSLILRPCGQVVDLTADIHVRLAKYAERSRRDRALDERTHLCLRNGASNGDTMQLLKCVGR